MLSSHYNRTIIYAKSWWMTIFPSFFIHFYLCFICFQSLPHFARFRRAAKRGKFTCGACNIVLSSRKKEIAGHQIIQIYDIALICTQFPRTLDNFKSFQWTRNSGIAYYKDQLQLWKFLKQNSIYKIWLIAFYVKIALQIEKKGSALFYADSYIFMFFKIAQIYLVLAV